MADINRHPLKQFFPIDLIELGMIIDENYDQP
jgi:hypothetical protein